MDEAKKREDSSNRTFFAIGILLMLVLIVRGAVLDLSIISDNSMVPILKPEEYILVNRLAYVSKTPQPGDLVSVTLTERRAQHAVVTVKRIIAVGGQTVEIRNGQVIVDGKVVAEPYLTEQTVGQFGPETVPPDHYFILGDNRNYSTDSRSPEIGFVSIEAVRGKPFFVMWPLKSVKSL